TAEEPAEEPAGNRSGLEEQEYQVLLKIVEAEAGGEDTVGRMLVANVIMNRVRSGRFPNTITEVVYQRCSGRAQFSPVSDGRIDQVSVSPETVEAVSRAINGEDASAGALYFRSVYSSSGWFDRALRRVVEHGNHIFYTM
ncbi:MAG: cell wall hydrolase, partial [Lachnospiraceae bacterium]|nr:cell wall hydrolase [Lachnospiraceae bacterium]